ncbi:hypothetical protein SUNI508_05003 [Seiridium unicorne]|uniref:Mitochondrial genome maintenance protein MGM101 n=1 Tax=Seiridium unicorne TaxID=138068 RepID=A0ABR2V6Y0_9PEZI
MAISIAQRKHRARSGCGIHSRESAGRTGRPFQAANVSSPSRALAQSNFTKERSETTKMSNDDKKQALQTLTEADDEPDEWDKRIFSTGCAGQPPKHHHKMASRTVTPLRVASRNLRLVQTPFRTYISPSKPKPASSPTAARPAASSTLKAPTKPATYSEGSRSAPTAAAKSSPISKSTPSNSPPAGPPGSHTPVPQVSDQPLPDVPTSAQTDGAGSPIDWSSSFHGLGTATFGPDVATMLQAPLHLDDIEVKPDGIIYLPEIKYRRVLNAAFGPGGWGLAPRGDLQVQDRLVFRDYALIAHGRFVGQARGEMQYFNEDGISTAAEGCKSNALMRCCKDLGIASELWDPRFIRSFLKSHAQQVWVEHVATKKKKQIWLRKDDEVRYPFKKTN